MRKQVVEIECARCDRVEHRDDDGRDKTPTHVFLAKIFAEGPGEEDFEVKFEDLCTPCKRTVRAMLEQIGKHIEGVSPDRSPKKPGATKKVEKGPGPNGPTPTPNGQSAGTDSKKPAARASS